MLIFIQIIAAKGRFSRDIGQECFSSAECSVEGEKCCALCPADAECGPGTNFPAKCQPCEYPNHKEIP
ncbi:unnamed protein product, partial [Mesorhabditis belari]|uniref:Uncharacterized protein n=1 Tax=Mesorhabditis belari TaxID=2138241 RepID=A0AAF3EP47_9BILA